MTIKRVNQENITGEINEITYCTSGFKYEVNL